MSQKYGANAIGLGRVLGMALPTTWNILHKLRRVMVRSDREKLGPAVEIDESYVGGHEEGKPDRGADAKALVILAVELSSEKTVWGASGWPRYLTRAVPLLSHSSGKTWSLVPPSYLMAGVATILYKITGSGTLSR
jgi:hypothetical protein